MAEFAVVFAIGLLFVHLITCALVIFRKGRKPAPAPYPRPKVTLLRPVCGIDSFDHETLRSGFELTYPELELIFCVASAHDPAAALVKRLIAEHPQSDARLLVGEDRITKNPKLNNLFKGWVAATGEVVVMADSNLLLPKDYIDQLLAMRGSKVGLVSCPPVGIRASGFWAQLECAFLNSNQARLQFAADALGFGFAQGKTMAWDKAFLDRAGGLAALGERLAEDVAATQVVRGAGLKVALPNAAFAQPIGRRSFDQVWSRQLRWSKVRREGFPGLFLLEPLNGAALTLLAAGLGGGVDFAGGVAAIWYAAETALARREGWIASVGEAVSFPVRDLLLPIIWLATLRNTSFEWRGNAMSPGALEKSHG